MPDEDERVQVVVLDFDSWYRMTTALRELGYSKHSGSPRIGPKAQTARWGLGEDTHPDEPPLP